MEVSRGGEPCSIKEFLTVFASAWKIMDVSHGGEPWR